MLDTPRPSPCLGSYALVDASACSAIRECWYNGLGHRITWHSDTSRSGGGAPDGTVDTNDPKVQFIYNERWQQAATDRQANGSNIDTHPRDAGRPMRAQFVNHAAGLAAWGPSSYIGGVIWGQVQPARLAAALGRNVLSAGHDGATASHGAGNLRNRRGLAGYEWDPHVRRYHVRNRVLYPEIGRWTRRDPLGYVDGMGMYESVGARPASAADPSGTHYWEPADPTRIYRPPHRPPLLTRDECNECVQVLYNTNDVIREWREHIRDLQVPGIDPGDGVDAWVPTVYCSNAGSDNYASTNCNSPSHPSILINPRKFRSCAEMEQTLLEELIHSWECLTSKINPAAPSNCAIHRCMEVWACMMRMDTADGRCGQHSDCKGKAQCCIDFVLDPRHNGLCPAPSDPSGQGLRRTLTKCADTRTSPLPSLRPLPVDPPCAGVVSQE